MNKIYTIGFTEKSAESFFTLLKSNSIKKLIDVRLNNASQLAAFSKKNDLKYFLKELIACDYIYRSDFAPSDDILKDYKSKKINWKEYADKYIKLLDSRNILSTTSKAEIVNSVLLCSENEPEYCHRRLLAEYFKTKWSDIEIIHLK
jgi:uncharacterized protein (DUF488 family)